jgi:hypothetical protein
MSADIDRQQAKINEFMKLLPLTIELAGLPTAAQGQHFNDGQLDVRVTMLKVAYKLARQLVIDISKPSE